MSFVTRNLAWMPLVAPLMLIASPAQAKTCGQQIFLSAALRLGPGVSSAVRQDQLKLQALEDEASQSLLRIGFSPSELKKVLAAYEASAPVYCFATPNLRPPAVLRPSPPPQVARTQLKALIVRWSRKFGISEQDAKRDFCGDCSVADAWRNQLRVALDPFNKSGIESEVQAAYKRRHFADRHKALVNGSMLALVTNLTGYVK